MKRQFEGFALQSGRLPNDPSKVYEDPKPIQAIAPSTTTDFDDYDLITGDATAAPQTNFNAWTETEIRTFLDQRGEEFEDCHDFNSLVKRAEECEANTGPAVRPSSTAAPQEEIDVDPLDAFMAEIEAIETKNNPDDPTSNAPPSKKLRHAERLEEDDHVADFLERRRQRSSNDNTTAAEIPLQHVGGGYNSDEEVYAAARAADIAAGVDISDPGEKRIIQPLAAAKHSEIEYEEFCKEFYEPAPEIAALDVGAVTQRRRALAIRVSGYGVPAPVETFAQCGFDSVLEKAILKAGYTDPTHIQAQALPVVLSGRDVLGVAKTGSGKTAAFVLPMIVHVMDQRELERGEGPIAVIAAPTRELAEQIHKEARK